MKSIRKYAAALAVMAAAVGMMGCKIAPEDPPLKQTVATPIFSVASGEVESETEVAISCATEGAVIHYTTDGEAPTASSATYSAAIKVTIAVTIKAIAVKDGMNDSEVAVASYTVAPKPGVTASVGIKIGNKVYDKTSEVIIIPAGETGVVEMTDDSSWNTFVDPPEDEPWCKGVFIKDRKVTLSPFVMGQYEVTQQLYSAVLGDDTESIAAPSFYDGTSGFEAEKNEEQAFRPVENVTWYDAVYFCNKLSEKQNLTPYYTITDIARESYYNYIESAKVSRNTEKGAEYGYRLPTEAEWEYAARGGDPDSEAWKNAFGLVTAKGNAKVYDGSDYLEKDENLDTVGWYKANSSHKTHEVGLKEKNNLNLYDMQGNVWEWCWDGHADVVETGAVTDPVGNPSGYNRCYRGGSLYHDAYNCTVSCRRYLYPNGKDYDLGFRVCRSSSK